MSRFVACFDAGRVINRASAEGQLEGGAVQGLGYALMEEIALENGVSKNPHLVDYRIPTTLDVPAIKGALGTEAFYIGALGSRRNQERRRERLLEAGVEEHQFERVSGPTGLDIGADTPAETALSILGEILATRAGRDGGFLRNSKTRIHVEEPRESADALARD